MNPTTLTSLLAHSNDSAGTANRQARETSATTEHGALPVITSDALLRGRLAVLIQHQGQHYRLQTTKQGKLILTK